MLAHFGALAHGGGIWAFLLLVALIVFVTLIAVGESKDKNK
jgi:hypothetical protein